MSHIDYSTKVTTLGGDETDLSEYKGKVLLAKGTKIVLELKDMEMAFATPQVVERVIKKYSNFVTYEITLNNGRLNTVEALWMKPKDEVRLSWSPEQTMSFKA